MSDPLVFPKPVSPILDQALTATLAKIPAGKPRLLSGAVTTKGVEGAFGWRLGANASVSAYAAKEYGSGWLAGARASWAF